MTDRNVYIFTPSYNGTPRMETFHALLEAADEIRARGWGVHFKFTVGDSLIPRARNMALADVYYHGDHFTDLIQIDDDVVWEKGAIIRLLEHDCDVVGGAYPKRKDPIRFAVKRLKGAEPDPRTGLMEVRMVPGGFLRIRTPAIRRMIEHYGDARAYRDPAVPGGKAWALFMLELAPDETDPSPDGINDLWGEDFTFCRLWREMGGKVMLDTLLSFQHIGRKSYEGCYAEHLPGFVEQVIQQSTRDNITVAPFNQSAA